MLAQQAGLSAEDIAELEFSKSGKIFRHKTLRINYTTYDLQRRSDVINIRTRPNIMTTAPEDDNAHPYQYGQLIDIFTVPIYYKGDKQMIGNRRQDVQVLWVRWYERDIFHHDGFSCLRLPQLSFTDVDDPAAHGFISPSDVLRAAHIIPAFAHKRVPDPQLLDTHATRFTQHNWNRYYVNM